MKCHGRWLAHPLSWLERGPRASNWCGLSGDDNKRWIASENERLNLISGRIGNARPRSHLSFLPLTSRHGGRWPRTRQSSACAPDLQARAGRASAAAMVPPRESQSGSDGPPAHCARRSSPWRGGSMRCRMARLRPILLKNSSGALLGTFAGVVKPFPGPRSSILGRSERSIFATVQR